MIVTDASALIAAITPSDEHHGRAVAALVVAESAETTLLVHPMTLAEALVAPARRGVEEHFRGRLFDLGLLPISVDDDAPLRIARLRARTRLPIADCCVLDAAVLAEASLLTFDDRLAKEAAGLGVRVAA